MVVRVKKNVFGVSFSLNSVLKDTVYATSTVIMEEQLPLLQLL